MSRRGKGRNALASIKDLIEGLELNEREGPEFKALTLNFLKAKNLPDQMIMQLGDADFHGYAYELLYKEMTPGKGSIGMKYWPLDEGAWKSLTFASNPSRIIESVSYIMQNQRKNLLSGRNRRRRQNNPSVENHEPAVKPGSSSTPGGVLEKDVELTTDDEEDSKEGPRESPDLPTVADILKESRRVRAAPYHSESSDPPSHLASPPITPAVSNAMRRRPTFADDSPHPSVERENTTAVEAQNFPPRRSLPSTTNLRDRRRERSQTAFAEYNPHLPTHRDGTLDMGSIKSWKDGVQFVRDRLDKFNRGLRREYREHPTATPEDHKAAQQIYYKSVGLDEFVEFLDSELQRQQKRLSHFKAAKAPLRPSEDRGDSCTVSPP